MASSSDGTRFVANGYGGVFMQSTDSGVTWTTLTVPTPVPSINWNSVASSADGMKLVASAILGPIYTSADGGLTWFARLARVLFRPRIS